MVIYNEYNTSVKKALSDIDKNWKKYNGLIICGSHNPTKINEQIEAIKNARETKLPFLGICFGYQLTAIEYARNILGIKDATSEEFGQGTLVVKKLPDINIGIKKVKNRYENFWNNYEVTIKFEIPENFFVCQYHPEYNSSKDNPHPLLLNFLQYAKMAMPNSKKPW